MMEFLTVLLRWPDLKQPVQMIQGYPIVGDMEPSGVFRLIPGREPLPSSEWVGAEAVEAIQCIERSRPPIHADRIFKATVLEQERGFWSEFFSLAGVNGAHWKGF